MQSIYRARLFHQGASPAQAQLFYLSVYLSFFHSFVSPVAQIPEAVLFSN